jgi:hypothetical protein
MSDFGGKSRLSSFPAKTLIFNFLQEHGKHAFNSLNIGASSDFKAQILFECAIDKFRRVRKL